MNDIFKSQVHQSHFNESGYVVMDALNEDEINEIDAFIKHQAPNLNSDFYYSLIANDLQSNRAIRDKIKCVLQSFYDRVLVDYKSLNESFLVKPARTSDELFLHQDWCYTHEEKFHSLTLWMPLCDVDEKNGALFFLRGSHTWFHNLRSSSFSTARISSNDFQKEKLQSVPMCKGQAVFFHPASFHGSFPNNSNENRIAVTSVILPQSADYVYFQAMPANDEKNVKMFKLDEDAFLRELKTMAVGADPACEIAEQFHYDHRVITPADLLLKAHE